MVYSRIPRASSEGGGAGFCYIGARWRIGICADRTSYMLHVLMLQCPSGSGEDNDSRCPKTEVPSTILSLCKWFEELQSVYSLPHLSPVHETVIRKNAPKHRMSLATTLRHTVFQLPYRRDDTFRLIPSSRIPQFPDVRILCHRRCLLNPNYNSSRGVLFRQ